MILIFHRFSSLFQLVLTICTVSWLLEFHLVAIVVTTEDPSYSVIQGTIKMMTLYLSDIIRELP